MKKLLITGANGFVGSALSSEAVSRGFAVREAVRSLPVGYLDENVEVIAVGDINTNTDWGHAVSGCDVVIHLAARVHKMNDSANDPLAEFRMVNTKGTEQLARCAAAFGVKRLVYVSSIKAIGTSTSGCESFVEENEPNPQDAYGISKWEAEQSLNRVSSETGLEVVIVRPPLIYGAEVKGNFSQMLRVAALGIPLPLAGVKNKRDLLYVGNLVDALIICSEHPEAAGNTYLVSDGEAVSTPDLIKGISKALGVSSRLFSCPFSWLKIMGMVLGKSRQMERLCESLQLDSSKICNELGWVPPFSLQQGLDETVSRLKVS